MNRVNIQQVQPQAYQAMFGLEGYIAKSTIEANLQEMVRIRASIINGCQFCIGMHKDAATKLGESNERIAALDNWKTSDLFNEKEQAVLAATDEITNISVEGLSKETYTNLGMFFSEEEIAQLIMLAAIINAWNRIGVSMAS
ncbi:carboxymuconolactone decarboxylase family protein [Thalassotalea nanhaiensis]|uniref:Carboxymuconolactone decarboxylase family protein n=1 Tax=Thalassotalea nanhaiensis TaxID=3065648 RepID=A0ABY9TDR6_9GAMM|nr:carboxymuconolactone decarboxylase family protein [Colwelliaceae bacterium SQ345]